MPARLDRDESPQRLESAYVVDHECSQQFLRCSPPQPTLQPACHHTNFHTQVLTSPCNPLSAEKCSPPDPRRLTEQREGLGTNPILGVLLVSALLTAAVVAVLLARRAVPEAAPIAPAEHACCALHGGTQVQDVWDWEAPSSP